MKLPIMLAWLIASLLTIPSGQQEPAAPNEKQIRDWVEQLANVLPPRTFRSPSDRLTRKERESLVAVQEAYEALTKHFLASLPVLVEHLDDSRFSYPSEHPSSGVFGNRDVGDACRSIIQRKLLLYNPTFIDNRDIAVGVYLSWDKAWYDRVKDMSLFEMQLDSLDRLAAQPKPGRIAQEDWNEAMKELKEFRTKFAESGKPRDVVFSPMIEGK